MRRISHALTLCAATMFAVAPPSMATQPVADLQVRIGYLAYTPTTGPLLSNVIPEPEDAGRRGAELAIIDSNSTGRFLKHAYHLDVAERDDTETLLAAARELHARGLRLFVVNAPANTLSQLSQALPDSLLLNEEVEACFQPALLDSTCLLDAITQPNRIRCVDHIGKFKVTQPGGVSHLESICAEIGSGNLQRNRHS